MTLTVTEAVAVSDLLLWLADRPYPTGGKVSEARAIDAIETLAANAGRRLQTFPDGALTDRILDRLAAADSDGAAQALARVVDAVSRRNGAGNLDIARALETWRRLQDAELGERLRDQSADRTWGAVDV